MFCILTGGSLTPTLYVREMAPPFNVVIRATGKYTPCAWWGESPDTLQSLPQGPSRLALEGRYAFHMVFQERWSFFMSSHYLHIPTPSHIRVIIGNILAAQRSM